MFEAFVLIAESVAPGTSFDLLFVMFALIVIPSMFALYYRSVVKDLQETITLLRRTRHVR
jgi:hypothetical protein